MDYHYRQLFLVVSYRISRSGWGPQYGQNHCSIDSWVKVAILAEISQIHTLETYALGY
jgi:hypothetical protein